MKKLIIVDMQKGFITKNNKFLVKNIENLLKKYEFDEIYATKFVNNEKSPFVKYLEYQRFFDKNETDFAIKFPKNVKLIEKTSYALPNLDQIAKDCDEVYLCGTDYDSCVLAIAFQLFDWGGGKTFIIENCVGSHSQNPFPFEDFKTLCLKNFGKNSLIELKI